MSVYIILLFYLTASLIIPDSINLTIRAYIPVVVTMLLVGLRYKRIFSLKNTRNEQRIFLLVFLLTMIALIFDRFRGMNYLYGCLMTSAMFILIMRSCMNEKLIRNLFAGVIILLIANSLMSYYERINMVNIIENRVQEAWENDYHNVGLSYIFRSTALLGHPLNNAFSISVLMCSILIMPLKPWIKYILWGMGMISLLCFNARGATILSPILLAIYLIYEMLKRPRVSNFFLIICIIGIFIYALDIVMNSSLAGRLATTELMDGSAQTRLKVWLPLGHMRIDELLIGFTQDRYREVCRLVKLNTMENWLAGFIYNMGIPFILAFLTYYCRIYYRALRGTDWFNRMYMMFAFAMLASLNNSLSMSFWPWVWTYVVFVLTSKVTSKELAERIIPKFMIDKKNRYD